MAHNYYVPTSEDVVAIDDVGIATSSRLDLTITAGESVHCMAWHGMAW